MSLFRNKAPIWNPYIIERKGSLPHSRFLDVTQRSPNLFFWGALRDVQKTAARETSLGVTEAR